MGEWFWGKLSLYVFAAITGSRYAVRDVSDFTQEHPFYRRVRQRWVNAVDRKLGQCALNLDR